MIWRIKKYDWSREVTWRENKSSCFPPDVVFPCRVSRHNALRCITSCYSFRYNKQLIAQLVGRHEDLSHPENSCLPRASPSGDMNFQGGTNLRAPSKLGNKCIISHAYQILNLSKCSPNHASVLFTGVNLTHALFVFVLLHIHSWISLRYSLCSW